MPDHPTVASLWIGPSLSFLEALCLKSFVDAGHRTKLYAYEHIENVPDGVEIADANDVLPTAQFMTNLETGTPGPHSDKFRYLLLSQTDEIWVDTDAYCVKPFPDTPYLFGSHYKHLLANGVLRLPKTSPTLKDLIDFTANDYIALPPDFRPNWALDQYNDIAAQHGKVHASQMPWETWGPFALTYFARKNDEAKHSTGRDYLYPVAGGQNRRFLQMPRNARIEIPDDAVSIHFYGSSLRNLLLERSGGVPAPRSYLGRLCHKHGIDPEQNPIPPKKAA